MLGKGEERSRQAIMKELQNPRVLEILKLLPRTNCHECGQPTCMVFAAKIAEGAKGPEDCTPLKEDMRVKLEKYISDFRFDL